MQLRIGWVERRVSELNIQGVGMTSQRTRDRLIDRLQQKGISSPEVLRVMRLVPRHLFVDEAITGTVTADVEIWTDSYT